MILAAAVESTDGCFGGFLCGCLGHPVMAVHRGLDRLAWLAHAVHGFRLTCVGQRQRPEGREEHSQQQESCSPTMHRFSNKPPLGVSAQANPTSFGDSILRIESF